MAAKLTKSSPYADCFKINSKVAAELKPDRSLLRAFAGGALDDQAFLSRYYRRKCVAFQGGGLERVQYMLKHFLHGGGVEELVHDTASDAISVWLKPRSTSSTARIDSIKVDAEQAMVCYAAGGSLYFRSPQALADAYCSAMSECVGLGAAYWASDQASTRSEVEVFAARPGHVTDWHFDFQENFTVQLSGRKRWWLKCGGSHSVVRGATPHYSTDAATCEMQVKAQRMTDAQFAFRPDPSFFEDAVAVVLEPGDSFYFPAGCWHRVEALGPDDDFADGRSSSTAKGAKAKQRNSAAKAAAEEDADDTILSINLSLIAPTWADVAGSAVKAVAMRDGVMKQLMALTPQAMLTTTDSGSSSGSSSSSSDAKRKGAGKLAGHKRAREEAGSSATTATASPFAPEVYGPIAAMLSRLQAAVAQLRPEHLLPPAALVSRRFAGIDGCDFPISPEGYDDSEEEQADEDSDADEEGSAGSAVSHSSGGKQQSSSTSSLPEPIRALIQAPLLVRFAEGELRVSILDTDNAGSKQPAAKRRKEDATGSSASANVAWLTAHATEQVQLNPLAVIHRLSDVEGAEDGDEEAGEGEGEDSEEEDANHHHHGGHKHSSSCGHSHSHGHAASPSAASGVSYIVHVNVGNEELSSFCRCRITVPQALAPAMDMLAAAYVTQGKNDITTACVIDVQTIVQAGGGSSKSPAAPDATAVRGFLRALAFAGAISLAPWL